MDPACGCETTRHQGGNGMDHAQRRRIVHIARSTPLSVEVIAESVGCHVDEVRASLETRMFGRDCGMDFMRLARGSDEATRIEMARNPDCPRQLMRWLALDPSPQVRDAMAQNASCPPEALHRLARDRSVRVRHLVAHNPSCPPDVLRRLARDRSVRVRHLVAHNPSCPPDVLRWLAVDSEPVVRSAAGSRPR